MNDARTIAQELGELKLDEHWLQQEIARLNKKSVVPLEHVKKHSLRLLAKCPKCNARLKIPALWEHGCCDRCQLSFGKMAEFQKLA